MTSEEAKAELYFTLAKLAVGPDPEHITNYCRFIGLENQTVLSLVEKKAEDDGHSIR